MKHRLFLLVCMSIMSMLYGCTSQIHADIPLVWEPTNDLYDADTATLTGLYSRKLQIKPFTDSRENKKEIAKNTEGTEFKLVTTKDDVADWCRSRFGAIIKQYGLNVVGEKADVIISGEVLQFYVIEDSTYKANVGIKITAGNAVGKILWQGIITGTARRFGHSYELENYYKTLSDAYLDAVNGLLKNQEFRVALQNNE